MSADLYIAASPQPAGPVPPGALVVCLDEWTREAYLRRGAPAALLDPNLWTLGPDAPVRNWGEDLAEAWFRDVTGSDFTVFRGISLGKCLEGLVYGAFFGPVYKFAWEFNRLLEREKPARVIAEREVSKDRRNLIERLCGGRAIPLEWRGAPAVGDKVRIATRYSSWPLSAHALKRRLLNWGLGFLRPRSGRRVLASYYYTLEGLLEELGRRQGVRPAFFDWPSRRLPSMRGWTRWSFLTDPSFEDPLRAADVDALEAIGRRWRELSSSADYARRFEPGGLPAWEAMRALLDEVVMEEFAFMASQLAKIQRALDSWAPELVVVPYDGNPPERMLLYEARRRGIPSALVQHGLPTHCRPRLVDTQADHLFIGGTVAVGAYLSLGVARERIHVTGFPLLDRYSGALRRRPVVPQVVVVGYCAPVRENILPVVELVRRHERVRIVVKTHPGEPGALYREILGQRLDARCVLEERRLLAEVLRESSLVIGGLSTSMIEAMAMGLPVVLVNLQASDATAPFDGSAGLPCHQTTESLAAALRELLPDRIPERVDHSRLLEAYAGRLDGCNVARTVDGVLGLLA